MKTFRTTGMKIAPADRQELKHPGWRQKPTQGASSQPVSSSAFSALGTPAAQL